MIVEPVLRKSPERKPQPEKISIEEFLEKYRKGAPGIKYEFNKGIVEQSEAMKFSEHYLIVNLDKLFRTTPAFQQDATLTSELEVWTSENQWRKPDLSFVTVEQTRLAMDDFEPIPEFVVEVISPNDKITSVKDKVYEYFKAGVKIIWHIFPHNQTVEIYRPNSKGIEVCTGSDVCSAEPVVKGFNIMAEDIFRRP